MRRLRESADIYADGNFEVILKRYKNPINPVVKSTVYENLFRCFSLMKSGMPNWKNDFAAIVKSGELEMLGEHDKFYVEYYVSSYIDPTSEYLKKQYFDESLVSNTTREFFPLPKITPESGMKYHFIDYDSTRNK